MTDEPMSDGQIFNEIQGLGALTQAVNSLTGQVGQLRKDLQLSQAQALKLQKQATRLKQLIGALVAVVLLSVTATYVAYSASDEVSTSQLQGCRNANESRNAAYTLWSFIIDVSIQGNPSMSDKERANLESIRSWVGQIYGERDCSDLTREYPIPDPPVLAR